MKSNRLLGIIIGIAIFAGIVCSGIIIITGIRSQTASARSAPRREKFPEPLTLEKTEIEEFSEASIHLDYANISILPSDGFYLEYRLDGTCKEPDYNVNNGKFSFQEGSTLEQYRRSFHLFGTPSKQEPFYLNLYVPEDQYFELLSLTAESGNAELEQINAKRADISLDYGNLNLGDFTGRTLSISAESGNIESNAITCDNLSITSPYGNITGGIFTVSNKADFSLESGSLELSQLTAGTLSIYGDYGNCKFGSITFKDGEFSLESGNLELYHATLENADITSEYGNVTLELADKPSDYNYNLSAEYGAIEIDGKTVEADEDGTIVYRKKDSQKTKNIKMRCESGSIDIR